MSSPRPMMASACWWTGSGREGTLLTATKDAEHSQAAVLAGQLLSEGGPGA